MFPDRRTMLGPSSGGLISSGAYVVEEDGGVAVAELADLPPRRFHVLLGQPPGDNINTRQHALTHVKTGRAEHSAARLPV